MLWPTPQEAVEELRRTKKRRGDSCDERGYRHMGMETPGVAAAMVVAVVTVGVAIPTTAVEESTAAKAEEARLVEGVNREAARILDEVTEAVAAALGEAAGSTRRREGSFHWFHFIFQLVVRFKFGPRRHHGGARRKASNSFLGGCCIFGRESEQT